MSFKDKLAKHKSQKDRSKENVDLSDSQVLGVDGYSEPDDSIIQEISEKGRLVTCDISKLEPDPEQPRKEFDASALSKLQVSIESVGQIQPVLVHPVGSNGKHKIIAGERRWRAISQSKEISSIDAIILDSEADSVNAELKILEIQIAENEDREDLSVIEESKASARYVQLVKQSGGTQKDAAQKLNLSTSAMSKRVSLAGASDEIVKFASLKNVKDIDALYDLNRLNQEKPEVVSDFISKAIKNDMVEIRSEVRKICEKELVGKPKSKKAKDKAKKQIPAVKRVQASSEDGIYLLSMQVGNKQSDFETTRDMLLELRNSLDELLESKESE